MNEDFLGNALGIGPRELSLSEGAANFPRSRTIEKKEAIGGQPENRQTHFLLGIN
jgi:hypothetical protein